MLRPSRFLAICASTFAIPAAALAITGVCPDGSIFIVQRAQDIPCPAAKQVDPNDVPPLKPHYLPRPYGWETFNRESDPNNPYNLVDGAPHPEAGDGGSLSTQETKPGAAPPQLARTQPPSVSLGPESRGQVVDVGLSAGDIADLGSIVDLMQTKAPATLVRAGENGQRRAVVRVARSFAFEQHLLPTLRARGTPGDGLVVLVRAVASATSAFFGNLTFVQGGVAFHPDTGAPAEFGILDGRLGALAPGDHVLAYAVLPQHMDLTQPMDIYWDDRRITATLLP